MYIFKATNKTKSKFAPERLLGHEDFTSECTMFRAYSYEGLNNDKLKALAKFPYSSQITLTFRKLQRITKSLTVWLDLLLDGVLITNCTVNFAIPPGKKVR